MSDTLKNQALNTTQKRTQAERTRATRDAIAQAAFEQIRDLGYANFRVASVASAAHVSSGALTHHFATKESVALAAIGHAIDTARHRTSLNIRNFEGTEHPDALTAFINECRDYYFSASFDVAMDVVKSATALPELRREIGRLHREYRTFVENHWQGVLQADGLSVEDASDLIALTASVIRGFAIRSMIRPDAEEFERLVLVWKQVIESHFIRGQPIRRKKP